VVYDQPSERPSDRDERLMLTGPTFSPGGFSISRPRPRLWPGARDAWSASGPRAVSSSRAVWRPAAGRGNRSERAAGRIQPRAVFPAAERGDSGASGPRAEFNLGLVSTVNSRIFYFLLFRIEFEFNSLIKFEPTG
jgi:hypothetical protein